MNATDLFSATQRSRRAVTAILIGIVLSAQAQAGYIPSLDTPPATFDIEARARNGNTGFEAVLFTPGNPSPGTAATQLNPVGAPIWNTQGNIYGIDYFDFEFTYTVATGVATWAIDFTQDGDFVDSEEKAVSTSPTLIGKGFEYVNLLLQGANPTNPPHVGVNLRNFTLNGTNFGSFATTSSIPLLTQLYEHDSGSYDVVATGSFTFTGNGGQERPRLWVQLGEPVSVTVPEPATLVLLGSAGLIGLVFRRRKQVNRTA